MRKLLITLGLTSFLIGGMTFADPLFGHVRLNVNLGGPPAIYQAPVYAAPVYQAAPPVDYYQAPVYAAPSYVSFGWGGGYNHFHGRSWGRERGHDHDRR